MIQIIRFSEKLRNTWLKQQKYLQSKLESGLGDYIDLENTLSISKYPATLVAHAMIAQKLLNNSSVKDKKIIELGFGTQPHIPLLTRYGADVIGIEIDKRVVDMIGQRGYNAIQGDAENDITESINRVIESVMNGNYLDKEQRYQKAKTILKKLYDITNKGGVHIHTTLEDEGFMVDKTDIKKIGYEIICYNEQNSYPRFLTILRK